jgi:hypothetical protein
VGSGVSGLVVCYAASANRSSEAWLWHSQQAVASSCHLPACLHSGTHPGPPPPCCQAPLPHSWGSPLYKHLKPNLKLRLQVFSGRRPPPHQHRRALAPGHKAVIVLHGCHDIIYLAGGPPAAAEAAAEEDVRMGQRGPAMGSGQRKGMRGRGSERLREGGAARTVRRVDGREGRQAAGSWQAVQPHKHAC